jgi:hypothetical protein
MAFNKKKTGSLIQDEKLRKKFLLHLWKVVFCKMEAQEPLEIVYL